MNIPALIAVLVLMAAPGFAQTSNAEYAEECREAVGPLPDFTCADGVPVAITVDGHPVETYQPGMTCDRPSLLSNGPDSDGQCVPYSRILNLSTPTMMVSVMCRQKVIQDPASLDYDEIDVIAHNPATGATCWFQASGSRDRRVSGKAVPSPTSAVDDSFWNLPETVAGDGCGNCHDNDPFMFSPFVGQVLAEVPATPFGPYFHVGPQFGFDAWPTETFALTDNTCTSCHRIGIEQTCGSLTQMMTGQVVPEGADALEQMFPLSHAMPPAFGQSLASWETTYGDAVWQIRSCCLDPDQDVCRRVPFPEGVE
jgi:hypothetical protein